MLIKLLYWIVNNTIMYNMCIIRAEVLSCFANSSLWSCVSLVCFCRFPTNHWLLVNFRTFPYSLYNCWVKPFNVLGWSFPDIPPWQLYCVNLYYINILKLRTYEWLLSVVPKYLLSLRLSSLYRALYKPSELVGLVKTSLTLY